jgi:hypothetical protein
MANSPNDKESGACEAVSDLLSKSVLFTAKIDPLKAMLFTSYFVFETTYI